MDDLTDITEEHIYTSDQKLKWFGYGEWVEEPDLIKFMYREYECTVSRVSLKEPYSKEEDYFGGHLCGYVTLNNDHTLYSKEDLLNDEIDCHGGITFNEYDDEKHIIGFDCAHPQDVNPSMIILINKYNLSERLFPIPEELKKYSFFNPTYKNVNYVLEECKSIVDQLIKMSEIHNEN